jgi:hypothetical protein
MDTLIKMADTPPTPKVKGKLPKWAIPVGIAGIFAVIIVLRKRKPAAGNATEPGAEGLTNQSFIPVTGENVAGVGAGNYGSSSSSNNEAFLREFLREQKEEGTVRRQEEKGEQQGIREREQSFYEKIFANLGTGGGAPASSGAPGISVAPPPEAAPAPSPPPASPPPPAPAPPAPKCSGEFGIWNPANGAPSPHSCYKYSRDRCADKRWPYKHVYGDGHVVCSPV